MHCVLPGPWMEADLLSASASINLPSRVEYGYSQRLHLKSSLPSVSDISGVCRTLAHRLWRKRNPTPTSTTSIFHLYGRLSGTPPITTVVRSH